MSAPVRILSLGAGVQSSTLALMAAHGEMMRDTEPQEWAKLIELDEEMRRRQGAVNNGARITGTLYIHRDCIPIRDVDLTTAEDMGQMDMFGEECEGMCGV